MLWRSAVSAVVLAAALVATDARAFDDSKYPDLAGQWLAVRIPGVGDSQASIRTSPGVSDNRPL